MSDFDPVALDILRISLTNNDQVPESEIPKIVAAEFRRQYEDNGDPGLYWLLLRAQELEQL